MATDRNALPLTPSAPAPAPSSLEPEAVPPLAERRRYSPPQLRHLGSVRDLTLGSRATGFEVGMIGMMV
jgi:hypothetical protein